MLLHSIVKKVSKPILGTVGPWLAPVRHAKQGLAIFVFHEVTENPSPYSRQCSTHCNESLFRRQLKWIRDRFLVIHPLQLDQGTIPPGSALLTFDDGYKSFRTVALPILEDADLPSIVFLNMDVVEGSPNAIQFYASTERLEKLKSFISARKDTRRSGTSLNHRKCDCNCIRR